MATFLRRYSTYTILITVVLAILLGIYMPQLFTHISFLGDIFINLLKLFALPLIASALITSIGSMSSSMGNLKSMARGAVIYMLISEIIAVSIALLLFNSYKPGVGLNPDLILHGKSYVAANIEKLNIANFMVSIFPNNIFQSLAHFDLLPVVIFSILFGIGCAVSGEKSAGAVAFFQAVREVANSCLHGVMLVAPIGIFALIGSGVAQSSMHGGLMSDFRALITFVAVLFIGLFLQALWQFIAVIVVAKQSAGKILQNSVPVFSTAFATSSSVATLPTALTAANELGATANVSRFMLPLCASINIGGMMMYEVAAALFFAQMLGVALPLSQQILVAVACILGGMAEGGIPETSMVSLVVVFRIVNIPLSAISILLPLDRIIDRVRTMVNIFGNMCGVIIVSRLLRKHAQQEIKQQ